MQTDKNAPGDMPTTGGARPGPVAMLEAMAAPSDSAARTGSRPVVLRIPAIQVDAEVERAFIVDGAMQNPSGPFVVAWYGQTERVGVPGNAVFAGHVDYADVGPAVFARIGELATGDAIEVATNVGGQLAYAVEWSEVYAAEDAPVEEILRQSDVDEITLITCDGAFDADTGLYSDRLIVRATRTS